MNLFQAILTFTAAFFWAVIAWPTSIVGFIFGALHVGFEAGAYFATDLDRHLRIAARRIKEGKPK